MFALLIVTPILHLYSIPVPYRSMLVDGSGADTIRELLNLEYKQERAHYVAIYLGSPERLKQLRLTYRPIITLLPLEVGASRNWRVCTASGVVPNLVTLASGHIVFSRWDIHRPPERAQLVDTTQ